MRQNWRRILYTYRQKEGTQLETLSHFGQGIHVPRILHLHEASFPMEFPLLLGPVVLCENGYG